MEITEIILALCIVLIIYAVHLSVRVSMLNDILEAILLRTQNILEIAYSIDIRSFWEKIERENQQEDKDDI